MKKKISFVCNEESIDLYLQLLFKFMVARGNRKIRVGGDEYDFSLDLKDNEIDSISINDVSYGSLSSAQQRDFSVIRDEAFQKIAVDANADADVPEDDSDVAVDYDILKELDEVPEAEDETDVDDVSCLECGCYDVPKNMDKEGLCPNCSNEPVAVDGDNLSDYARGKARTELDEHIRMTRIFTAFDVTKKLRAGGVRCKHEDVKQLIHNSYLTGAMVDYRRSLVDVGTDIQPWLYCPISRDPSDYNHGDN